MRILFVSSSSGSHGGGELFLYYLGAALKSKGATIGYWVSSDKQMDALVPLLEEVGDVIRAKYVNTYLRKSRCFSHLLATPGELTDHENEWKAFNPDVVHINKQCLEDGLDLLIAANQLNIPHCCTVHITQSPSKLKARFGHLRDWLCYRVLNHYDGEYLAISKARATGLKQFLKTEKQIDHIDNGVVLPQEGDIQSQGEKMRSEQFSQFPEDAFIAVAVGRLEPQKDPLYFIDLMIALKKRQPLLQAIWVGDGRMRSQFEERISTSGAEKWIRCVGWKSDASPYLSMADLYVHPAQFEGLPFALLEAMARRKPCLIRPELADELEEIPRETWILAPENSKAWLDTVLDDKERALHSRRAFDEAEKRFSLDAMAEAYLRVYENLMTK